MSFKNGMRPVHPGEVLREDFLRPAGMTANALAKALRVPAPRINDIVRKRRGITADTAMRLARYFGGDAQSWLNLQTLYDLRIAEKANARKIDREVMRSPVMSPNPLPQICKTSDRSSALAKRGLLLSAQKRTYPIDGKESTKRTLPRGFRCTSRPGGAKPPDWETPSNCCWGV
jgi:addiction module HigA family antidote